MSFQINLCSRTGSWVIALGTERAWIFFWHHRRSTQPAITETNHRGCVFFFLQKKYLEKASFLVYCSVHIQSPVRFALQIQISNYLRKCPLWLTFTKICMVCGLRAFLKTTQNTNGTDKRMQNSSLNKLLLLHYLLIETVANSLKSRSIP